MSILVRAIYQTREFEERFLQIGLGYRVLGGIKFYERAEIKDAVAYLRIINQKFDDLALERVIGTPKRGIGEATLPNFFIRKPKQIMFGRFNNKDDRKKGSFKPKVKVALSQLIKMVQKWRVDSKT